MKEEIEDKKELITTDATANAVQVIKAAILQSQQRALKAIEIYNMSVLTDDSVLISVNSSVQTAELQVEDEIRQLNWQIYQTSLLWSIIDNWEIFVDSVINMNFHLLYQPYIENTPQLVEQKDNAIKS